MRRIKINKPILLMLIAFFLFGLAAGIVVYNLLAAERTAALSAGLTAYFTGGTINTDLAESILKHGKSVAIIWLAGFLAAGLPIIPGVIFLRGMAIGFMAVLMSGEGPLGIAQLLPQNLVMLPCIVFAAYNSILFALRRRDLRSGLRFKNYAIVLAVGLALSVVAAVIELLVFRSSLGL